MRPTEPPARKPTSTPLAYRGISLPISLRICQPSRFRRPTGGRLNCGIDAAIVSIDKIASFYRWVRFVDGSSDERRDWVRFIARLSDEGRDWVRFVAGSSDGETRLGSFGIANDGREPDPRGRRLVKDRSRKRAPRTTPIIEEETSLVPAIFRGWPGQLVVPATRVFATLPNRD